MAERGTAFTIRFEGVELDRANDQAQQLREFLLDEAQAEAAVDRVREDPADQGAGAVLAVALHKGVDVARAALKLANGLVRWFEQGHKSSIRFRARGQEFVVDHLTSQEAAGLAEKLIPLLESSS